MDFLNENIRCILEGNMSIVYQEIRCYGEMKLFNIYLFSSWIAHMRNLQQNNAFFL